MDGIFNYDLSVFERPDERICIEDIYQAFKNRINNEVIRAPNFGSANYGPIEIGGGSIKSGDIIRAEKESIGLRPEIKAQIIQLIGIFRRIETTGSALDIPEGSQTALISGTLLHEFIDLLEAILKDKP